LLLFVICFIKRGKYLHLQLSNMLLKSIIISFITLISFCSYGQDIDTLFSLSIEELLNLKVRVGTRGENKSVYTSLVPVDVITKEDLASVGTSDLGLAIHRLLPYVQYYKPVLMDGADHVFPLSIHGFSADQLLVFVNGKRWHQSALIYENSRINKGASAIDFRVFPINLIERVEILKDGASAQYGSDAIAGAINIVLKSNANTSGNIRYGHTGKGDGRYLEFFATANKKFKRGTLQFFTTYNNVGQVDRAGLDDRQQYFAGDLNEPDGPIKNSIYGTASAQSTGIGLLSNFRLSKNVELFTNGLLNARIGESYGYFRRPLDNRNIRAIYPNGFLPIINPTIFDYSFDITLKTMLGKWQADFSAIIGGNNIDFNVKNSLNASMGLESPLNFDCGSLYLWQQAISVNSSRTFKTYTSSSLVFAAGGEYKVENYTVTEGELASYIDGGSSIIDGPNAGSPAPAGAQVLPGFKPTNAISELRTNTAAYIDIENRFSHTISIGTSARIENYTDFGTALSGKLSARYEPIDYFALRASVGNGFRAPSLAQSYYSSTVTNFIDGIAYENGTFTVNHPISIALGAKSLKPESTIHYTLGLVTFPVPGFMLSFDFYQTEVANRIVFSGNFTSTNAPAFASLFQDNRIGGARFFTNSISTITKGIDFLTRYERNFSLRNKVLLSLFINVNKIKLNGDPVIPAEVSNYASIFFDRGEVARVISSTPKTRVTSEVRYSRGNTSANLRVSYFGTIRVVHSVALPETDQTIRNGTIFDLGVEHKFKNGFSIGTGGLNVFNRYPQKSTAISGDSFTGKILPYNPFVPYGFEGGRIYLYASYVF